MTFGERSRLKNENENVETLGSRSDLANYSNNHTQINYKIKQQSDLLNSTGNPSNLDA